MIDVLGQFDGIRKSVAYILAHQAIAVGTYPEHMVVGIIIKVVDTVTEKLFELSFVLHPSVDFIFGLCIVFPFELHFVDETLVRDSEAVVLQVADFIDGRVLVVSQVVGNLDGSEGFLLQIVADDAFKVSTDKEMSVVNIHVLDVLASDAPIRAVDGTDLSVSGVVSCQLVVPVGEVEHIILGTEHLVQLLVG